MDDFDEPIEMDIDDDNSDSSSSSSDDETDMKAGFNDFGRVNIDYKNPLDKTQKILDNYRNIKHLLHNKYNNDDIVELNKEKLKYLNYNILKNTINPKKSNYSVDELRYLRFLTKIKLHK